VSIRINFAERKDMKLPTITPAASPLVHKMQVAAMVLVEISAAN